VSEIRGVIVDFGGVLSLPPSDEALSCLHDLSGLDPAAFLPAWWRHRLIYDLGHVGAAEYWRLVGGESGREYDEATLAQLAAADAACWAVPNLPMIAWLGALKKAGLKVALLSNMPRDQWATLQDGLSWLSLCDVVALSYELGIAKPNPGVYRWCLDQLSLAPGEVIFVDDQPDNVAAAAGLGMNALLFTTVAELRRALAAHFDGVPPPAAT
jgi:putative hydrolase of the HAD superfamily